MAERTPLPPGGGGSQGHMSSSQTPSSVMLDGAKEKFAGAMSEVSASLGSLFSSASAGMGSTPGSARQMPLSSSTKKDPTTGNRPEDIPKEELMHLCMKMNRRMQGMDAKLNGLSRVKSALLKERKALLEHVRETTPISLVEALPDPAAAISLHVAPRDDEPMTLDVPALTMLRMQYDNSREQQLTALNKKVRESRLMGNVPASSTSAGNSNNTGHGASASDDSGGDVPRGGGASTAEGPDPLTALATTPAVLDHPLSRALPTSDHAAAESQPSSSSNTANTERVAALQNELAAAHIQIEEYKQEAHTATQQVASLRAIHTATENTFKDRGAKLEATAAGEVKKVAALEEKVTYLQIQLKNLRSEKEERDGELAKVRKAHESAQGRLAALETTHATQAAESSLEAAGRIQELTIAGEESRQKCESLTQRVDFLQTRLHAVQTEVSDKDALITRLRNESQTVERNHAMKVAMLAASESALSEARTALEKGAASLAAAETRAIAAEEECLRLEARITELGKVREATAADFAHAKEHMLSEHERGRRAMEEEHARTIEQLTSEHGKKESVLQKLLQKREADLSGVSAKAEALQQEIATGAPNERRIFELAAAQAKREAGQGAHRDARELAFVQLQEALVKRDYEVATLMQARAVLEDELIGLRRHTKRDGVNMTYLKNVVWQFMVFPISAPERTSLVPVIATLLQFSPDELKNAERAARNPNFNTRPVKEIMASMAAAQTSGGKSSPSSLSSNSPRAAIRPPQQQQQHQQRGTPTWESEASRGGKSTPLTNKPFASQKELFRPPAVAASEGSVTVGHSPLKI